MQHLSPSMFFKVGTVVVPKTYSSFAESLKVNMRKHHECCQPQDTKSVLAIIVVVILINE